MKTKTNESGGMRRRQWGVTLIELMVGLAILAILAAVAAPNFSDAIRRSRVTSQTNNLLQALVLARSEAIKTRQAVTVCPSNDLAACTATNDWSNGWIVINAAGTVIQAWDGPGAGAAITTPAGVNTVRYLPSGMIANAADVNITHKIAGCSDNESRVISIRTTGRAAATQQACS